jgi:hypothetical protein
VEEEAESDGDDAAPGAVDDELLEEWIAALPSQA